jgi:hypothetical protein
VSLFHAEDTRSRAELESLLGQSFTGVWYFLDHPEVPPDNNRHLSTDEQQKTRHDRHDENLERSRRTPPPSTLSYGHYKNHEDYENFSSNVIALFDSANPDIKRNVYLWR